MAKTLSEAAITTKNARTKLEPGIHWRGIDPDVHLGYRKGKRGGVWLVRWRKGAGYCQEGLGTADDQIAEGALDFDGAVRAARDKVVRRRRDMKAAADGPVQTVRTAVETYLVAIDARYSARAGRPVRSSASYRLGVFLPADMAASSRRRLVNDLRAALNSAAKTHRRKLPANLTAVIRPGLELPGATDDDAETSARDSQNLPDTTIGRVIAAAQRVDAEKLTNGLVLPNGGNANKGLRARMRRLVVMLVSR